MESNKAVYGIDNELLAKSVDINQTGMMLDTKGAMEQKMGIIGHVDHGKTTLTAAIAKYKAENPDVIIVDEGNLESVQEQLLQHKRDREGIFGKPFMPLINPYEDMELPNMPYHKKYKKNTGLSIGSYRFKSK